MNRKIKNSTESLLNPQEIELLASLSGNKIGFSEKYGLESMLKTAGIFGLGAVSCVACSGIYLYNQKPELFNYIVNEFYK